MSALELDAGHPEPWVTVKPFIGGGAIAVYCSRCGAMPYAYLVLLKREPGLLAKWVEEHNQCKERVGATP